MIDYCLFSYWQSDYEVATAADDAGNVRRWNVAGAEMAQIAS